MAAIKENETTPPNSGGKKVVLSRLCLCVRDVCVGEILTLDNASMKCKACAKRVSIWDTRSCIMWSHHDVPVQEHRCQIGSSSLSHKFVLNYAICARRAGTAVCSNADTTITCRITYDLQEIILSFTGNIYSCIVLNFFPKIGKIIAPFQRRSGFVCLFLRQQDDVQTNQIIKVNKCGTRGYLLRLTFYSQATPACVCVCVVHMLTGKQTAPRRHGVQPVLGSRNNMCK